MMKLKECKEKHGKCHFCVSDGWVNCEGRAFKQKNEEQLIKTISVEWYDYEAKKEIIDFLLLNKFIEKEKAEELEIIARIIDEKKNAKIKINDLFRNGHVPYREEITELVEKYKSAIIDVIIELCSAVYLKAYARGKFDEENDETVFDSIIDWIFAVDIADCVKKDYHITENTRRKKAVIDELKNELKNIRGENNE